MDQKHLLCEAQLSDPWRDLSSSAPEVVVSTAKEAAKDEGKEVAPGHGPEVIQQEHLPEVLGADGDKEVAYAKSNQGNATPVVLVKWLKQHKRSRWSIAVVLVLVLLAIALSAGLGIAMRRKYGVSSFAIHDIADSCSQRLRQGGQQKHVRFDAL